MQRIAWTTDDLARSLGCKPHCIRSRITTGKLPAVKLPTGRYLVLAGDEAVAATSTASARGMDTLRVLAAGGGQARLPEVAEALGLSIDCLRSLADRGDFPVFRMWYRGWRYVDLAELAKWLMAHRTDQRRKVPSQRSSEVAADVD